MLVSRISGVFFHEQSSLAGTRLVTHLHVYVTCSPGYVTVVKYYVILVNCRVIIDNAQCMSTVCTSMYRAVLWYAYYATTLRVRI